MTFAARFIGWVKSLFQAQRSLRLRAIASAYLSRTAAAGGGNQKVLTYSGWVKRGVIGGTQALLASVSNGAAGYEVTILTFTATNTIRFVHTNNIGASIIQFDTTAVFRDPSAWYHVVLQVDTNQATNTDGVKVWVNGVLQGGTFAAYFQNAQLWWTAPSRSIWQGYTDAPSSYYDGYLSDLHFIDGQALTPSSFGEFDPSGNWRPKAYTGTYGTNGFHLDFSDPTSLTTLMADSSGNGNNWTANNISLTAGITYDSMLDVPLGGGGNERGNCATLNPLKGAAIPASANLSVAQNASAYVGTVGTIGVTSGKWYWEFLVGTMPTAISAGIASEAWLANGLSAGCYFYHYDGGKYIGSSNQAYSGNSYTTGDILGFGLDFDAGTLTCYKNNISQGVLASGLTGTLFPAITLYGTGGGNYNFGQRPFAQAVPSGFKALHTGNLPEPAITNPSEHFKAVLWSGNATVRSISDVGFEPGLVWGKARNSGTANLRMFDVVRGPTKELYSSTTLAEATDANGLTSFNSDGFGLGVGASFNNPGDNYVAWCFKAGGAAVANNNGSIASQVSANVEGGFSIVTYTGNSIAATVGHGLSAVPKMIITARRASGGAYWGVYHEANLATHALYLQTADAKQASAGFWNNTAPSSTVFSLGGSAQGNSAGVTYVAYCFAEVEGYSRIGTYNANGSADGPFVYCGFEPAFVLVKRTDSAGEWRMHDNARSPFNSVDKILRAEQTTAEGLSLSMDFTATGFKIRTTDANLNGGAAPYIFLAIAKTPTKYALAR